MNINNIIGLSYTQFKEELKSIEFCLNHNFQNRTITYDNLFWELNYIIYGLDIHCDDYKKILFAEGKLIFNDFQTFYYRKNKPCFVIIIEGITQKESISNINIRLLK
ncbi:hypothetical protein AXY43_16035 [Clostridium sp. MF28]|uniref:hypothetical protein n=1 Tax=Clostridium TaxID=1485 RepID=UPI000CF9117F|nr:MULTISPECIES: hypothetical protein [Clostridium]AVK49385.1 hypothetical protein AXY43_16035 [Clostridium sp. MF28]PSM57998.1 hypothetical protein C4L39_09275 [Clostridium diolis]